MLAIGGLFSWLGFSEFLAMDRCLDSGGSYSSLDHVCRLPDARQYSVGWLDGPFPAVLGLIFIGIGAAVSSLPGVWRNNVP
jgi:hypothetical protein